MPGTTPPSTTSRATALVSSSRRPRGRGCAGGSPEWATVCLPNVTGTVSPAAAGCCGSGLYDRAGRGGGICGCVAADRLGAPSADGTPSPTSAAVGVGVDDHPADVVPVTHVLVALVDVL